ncbi:chromate transporter [Enterococcus alishanensis]|uniref:Chromate transporter n=1 Tax=Enterococcus alishanensis TaxID=1303817 RepID=A0ABS6TFI7_9ENTE|nr:chromate transporter [Enterococcus alishanensis]MBV7391711.1 chromate transporter [Enterococcus alishanensis]
MLLELFWRFFKIGLFSFGGGYAIIPLIQAEVVEQQGWLTQKVFTDVITISQMTPGPLAINTSTFVGMQVAGISGALVATIGAVIAGVIISLLLFNFFQSHQESKVVSTILQGLKASSAGLIASAALTIILLTFFTTSEFSQITGLSMLDIRAVIIFIGSWFLLKRFEIHPILLLCLAGVFGFFVY